MIVAIIIIIILLLIIIFKNKKNNKKESIFDDKDDFRVDKVYERINNSIYKEKVKSYVEKMTLNEVTQLLPSEIFAKTPKKREQLNKALINEICNGNVNVKVAERHYYVDADKPLENDRDYYYEGINERKDSIKKFDPIINQNKGISINMDIFSNVHLEPSKKETKKVEHNNDVDNVKNLEEKIKIAITLEPIKKNYNTFNVLLNEYNKLSIDEKVQISRKYTSELESLKNKTERL